MKFKWTIYYVGRLKNEQIQDCNYKCATICIYKTLNGLFSHYIRSWHYSFCSDSGLVKSSLESNSDVWNRTADKGAETEIVFRQVQQVRDSLNYYLSHIVLVLQVICSMQNWSLLHNIEKKKFKAFYLDWGFENLIKQHKLKIIFLYGYQQHANISICNSFP